MNILVGNDPEIFIKKDGELVSAHGLINGTKERPHAVRNGMVQVDGMALEFGIVPAKDEDEFVFRIQDVMAQLQSMIPDYELVLEPTAEFGEEYINTQPIEAKEIGCGADWNAWDGEVNATPSSSSMRTAGGHIHIGWNDLPNAEGNRSMGAELVKQLDFFLGLPSVLFDADTKRRSMYGAAGAFRPKKYGVEYRTLSNAWLRSEELMRLVYSNTHKAITALTKGDRLWEEYGDVQQIINTSDKDKAIGIMKSAGVSYE